MLGEQMKKEYKKIIWRTLSLILIVFVLIFSINISNAWNNIIIIKILKIMILCFILYLICNILLILRIMKGNSYNQIMGIKENDN